MYHGKYVDFCVCGSYWFTNLSFFFIFYFFIELMTLEGYGLAVPLSLF